MTAVRAAFFIAAYAATTSVATMSVAYGQAPQALPPARLELRSTQPDVAFHWTLAGMNDGTPRAASFLPLCVAPCSASLPAGRYRIGLALPGGEVVPAGAVLDLRGAVEIEGEVRSRASLRAAGWVLFVGSALAGAYLVTASEMSCTTTRDATGSAGPTMCGATTHPWWPFGAGVWAVGLGGGTALALWSDRAELYARTTGP